jgi:hypothetical protein
MISVFDVLEKLNPSFNFKIDSILSLMSIVILSINLAGQPNLLTRYH